MGCIERPGIVDPTADGAGPVLPCVAGMSPTEVDIGCVCEPQPGRPSERTVDVALQFGVPLALADRVVVTDVYPAGERPQPGVSGKLVAEAARAAGGSVEYVPNLHDVPAAIADRIEPGDVVLMLGAGDVFSISGELAAALGGEALR